MAAVRSTWCTRAILPTGTLSAPEWGSAGMMLIPGGALLAMNDQAQLYLALDLAQQYVAPAGPEDYFWLSVDVGGDGRISPHRDVNFASLSGIGAGPCRIERRLYVGPRSWTGILEESTALRGGAGVGSSARSAAPHRIWELSVPLRHVGIDLGNKRQPAVIRFGLRTATGSPRVTLDYPPSFTSDFSYLHEIHLASAIV